MEELLTQAVQQEQAVPLPVLTFRLVIAFGMGCVAAGIHEFTAVRGRRTDQSFLATLVLLAILIALLTLVIGNSLARAFSLAGALAIVRFRTVVDDTRDTAFVIFAVVAGMAAGTGYVLAPLICTPLVLVAAFAFRLRRLDPAPLEGRLALRLSAILPPEVRTSENLTTKPEAPPPPPPPSSPTSRVEQIMVRHVSQFRLSALATARGGSAFDATYTIRMPSPATVVLLVNELSRVEGVQSVELKEG